MLISPPLRITLALAAAVLFILGLAYWWQGNLFHEIVGTAFLVLLIGHNLTVLRWYGALAKGRWNGRRAYATAVNVVILCIMLLLALSSLLVSQALFAWLPFNIGFRARDLHVVVAYWAIVVIGLHLGLHWSRVLAGLRIAPLLHRRPVAVAARALAAVIAVYGVYSWQAVLLGNKLLNIPALEMWDFNANASGFFVHYGSILGLAAVVGYYFALWLQSRRGRPALRQTAG